MNSLVIYGGTFDPPHDGHLNTARSVQQQCCFDRFVFLPCHTPALKSAACASTEQRLAMLTLALEDDPDFNIDTREIDRGHASYMIDTLTSFREELGEKVSIILCMGMDAFRQLPQWKSWGKLLTKSHLLIMQRPQSPAICPTLKTLLSTHEVFDKALLKQSPHGKIYQLNAGHYPISSSWLRQQISLGHNMATYMPARVYQYIQEHYLYLP